MWACQSHQVSSEKYNKINNGFEYSNYGYGPNDTNKTFVIDAKPLGVVGAGGLSQASAWVSQEVAEIYF